MHNEGLVIVLWLVALLLLFQGVVVSLYILFSFFPWREGLGEPQQKKKTCRGGEEGGNDDNGNDKGPKKVDFPHREGGNGEDDEVGKKNRRVGEPFYLHRKG